MPIHAVRSVVQQIRGEDAPCLIALTGFMGYLICGELAPEFMPIWASLRLLALKKVNIYTQSGRLLGAHSASICPTQTQSLLPWPDSEPPTLLLRGATGALVEQERLYSLAEGAHLDQRFSYPPSTQYSTMCAWTTPPGHACRQRRRSIHSGGPARLPDSLRDVFECRLHGRAADTLSGASVALPVVATVLQAGRLRSFWHPHWRPSVGAVVLAGFSNGHCCERSRRSRTQTTRITHLLRAMTPELAVDLALAHDG
jgi:hypothetical protein